MSEFTVKELPDGSLQIGDGSTSLCNGFKSGNSQNNLNIPEKITSKIVSVIGKYAFYRCASISSLSLPSTITEIHQNAFDVSNIPIDTLNLNAKSIGGHSFATNRIKTVKIGVSLSIIGDGSFTNNPTLEEFIVDEQNPYFMNDAQGMLLTRNMKILCVPPTKTSITIPQGVRVIGFKAFEISKVRNLVIPESVKEIQTYGLRWINNLEVLTLCCCLTKIGYHILEGTKLTLIVYLRSSKLPDDVEFSMSVTPNVIACKRYKSDTFGEFPVTQKLSYCYVPRRYLTCIHKRRNGIKKWLLIMQISIQES